MKLLGQNGPGMSQNAFGNICFKFCVHVLRGLWVKVAWPYRIGPADRAQRLNNLKTRSSEIR